jgi:hypothetical protein|tara:strand:- start:295 stop:546 length:252 start_codon:yes stop_codon:yes gene_type:complete
MTRRDFQLIAATIKNTFSDIKRRERIVPGSVGLTRAEEMLVEGFAEALKTTNPLFSEDRFVVACGGGDERSRSDAKSTRHSGT